MVHLHIMVHWNRVMRVSLHPRTAHHWHLVTTLGNWNGVRLLLVVYWLLLGVLGVLLRALTILNRRLVSITGSLWFSIVGGSERFEIEYLWFILIECRCNGTTFFSVMRIKFEHTGYGFIQIIAILFSKGSQKSIESFLFQFPGCGLKDSIAIF